MFEPSLGNLLFSEPLSQNLKDWGCSSVHLPWVQSLVLQEKRKNMTDDKWPVKPKIFTV